MAKKIVLYGSLAVLGVFFLFRGLVLAKDFLIPVAVALLLSLLLIPLSRKLESMGFHKALAIILCDLLLVLAFLGVFAAVSVQATQFSDDLPELKKEFNRHIENVQEFIQAKTGISEKTQEQRIEDQINGNDQTGSSKNSSMSAGIVENIISNLTGFIISFLLVLVYIFFFMFYRFKFKGFILRLVGEHRKDKAREIISRASTIAQEYLVGKFILIIFLSVLYSVGLTIVGIKYAIFISVIAAILSLLPYIGNVVGAGFAIALALLSKGGLAPVFGVIVVFSIAQFVESYILEPFVVGSKVDLNPVVTIVVVVLGGVVWDVAGMVIAIPFLGILKVVFDNVPPLKPFGYLLGNEDISAPDSNGKMKAWIKKIFN